MEGKPSLRKLLNYPPQPHSAQEMLQEFHKNNPQAVGPVKATLSAMKLPPAHKNYVLAVLPGGRKSLLPKKKSNVTAIVFPGVAQLKRHHPRKPGPKPRLLVAIVDLNLTIDCKWVVAQEIGSKWGADAPRPIFPSLTCWSTNPDLKEGQMPDSDFSSLQFPGNLPPPEEMIPETCKIECEPIYAADSLMLSQIKVSLMYLCIIFFCIFPYSLFKGYHFQVNKHHLLLIDNVILIWIYIPHLINYYELSLLYPERR
ncbi:hypothetical protein DSO57_1034025 [Entomophthora muscae]|uniref:Uncharacterized protein n=1 Tax=Entomophthora muscae TaxID=34485 RepID=A0ACC2T0U8_9FUNG|nr:hypothetical protein DSO57_1034025 [Entomophthora muscae]